MEQHFLILGAGHAAAQLAASLRQDGWHGSITLLGEEDYPPYNRPPLSKAYLAGRESEEALLIRSAGHYHKAGINCLTGRRAVRLLRHEKRVLLEDGTSLSYDRLALTLGSRVRQLDVPGADLGGIFYLRNIRDVQQIRQAFKPGGRAVIIGGGFIGLETAAVLQADIGMQVTLLQAGGRLLDRLVAPEVSAYFQAVHEEEGVRIFTNSSVTAFEGQGRVEAVCCADGERYPADLVIVGIGIKPNTELATAAGLAVDDGILVDGHCQSSDPDIFAAGDCSRFFSSTYQRSLRLESIQNAVDQAQVIAASACGKPREYTALPWFWSDQYDLKLQIAGIAEGHDEVLVRQNSESRKFAAFYFREGRLLAVDAVNYPQAFMLGKTSIIAGRAVDRDALADGNIPLRSVL